TRNIIFAKNTSLAAAPTAANELMRITEVGNVGIGTTNPGTRLTVVGSGNYSIDASDYKIGGVATPTANTDAANKAYVDSAIPTVPAQLWSGTLNGNIWNGAAGVGNVGIGTTAPGEKLVVIGGASFENYFQRYNEFTKTVAISIGSGEKKYITFTGALNGVAKQVKIKIVADSYGASSGPSGRIVKDYSFYISSANTLSSQVSRVTDSFGDIVSGTRIFYPGEPEVSGSDLLIPIYHIGASTARTLDYHITVSSSAINDFKNIAVGSAIIETTTPYTQPYFNTSLGVGTKEISSTLEVKGAGSTSGTSALNVSNLAGVSSLFVRNDGNVGIGTTNPGTRLTVVGSGNYSIDASDYKIGGVATPTANTDAANKAYVDSAIPASLWSGTLNGNIWNGAAGVGNVGIGVASPGAKLTIIDPRDSVSDTATYNDFSLMLGHGVSNTNTAVGIAFHPSISSLGTPGAAIIAKRVGGYGVADLIFKTKEIGTADSPTLARMTIRSNGNVGIGTTTPGSKLHVVGNANITSTLTMGGDINMANNNITAINKLTVNTIDPLYNIKGVNYSTFAPSMVGGVKEEYVGLAKIDQMLKTGEYEKIIDFDQVAEGSDLWVWHKTIDFSPNNVQVIITPIAQFANTYYFIEDDKLVLRADKEVDISYRLTGNRHDWKEWPTRALDQTEKAGFIIN
ncbi:MAG: hypothetical protein WC967_15490, partial [Balneolaceae bacterium]